MHALLVNRRLISLPAHSAKYKYNGKERNIKVFMNVVKSCTCDLFFYWKGELPDPSLFLYFLNIENITYFRREQGGLDEDVC